MDILPLSKLLLVRYTLLNLSCDLHKEILNRKQNKKQMGGYFVWNVLIHLFCICFIDCNIYVSIHAVKYCMYCWQLKGLRSSSEQQEEVMLGVCYTIVLRYFTICVRLYVYHFNILISTAILVQQYFNNLHQKPKIFSKCFRSYNI